MIQNILTFCVKNDLTFVEGSIPSGKLVANDINRNSIYLVTPYDESIVKANFQTNLQSDTPTSVLGILVNGKISVDEIVDTTASYYNLVKDWNIYEFKVPSTTLSFISRNRTGKIGINFSIEQRLVPTIKDSYGEYQGEILSQAQSLTESGYYINKTIEFELDTGEDVFIYNLNDILVLTKRESPLEDIQVKISAYSNRGSTPTTLYSVDPSLLNDNFETIQPGLTQQIVQQVNDNTGDIVLLFQNIGVNNATLIDLENRVSVAEQDIDTAEANITNLQGRMATAESDIDNIEDGTTIVEKALRDSLGNIIKDSYVSSVYPTYNDTTDKLFIETYDVRDGLLANNEVILPKATTTKNGLMAKEDKAYVDGLPSALLLKENKSEKNQINGYAGLDGNAKIPSFLLPDSILGQLEYRGVFNPSIGYPLVVEKGYYYIASVGGTIDGVVYNVGDWAVYNGSSWDKVDNTDAVASVNEKTGAVVLKGTDIKVSNTDDVAIDARILAMIADINNRYTKAETYTEQEIESRLMDLLGLTNLQDTAIEFSSGVYDLAYNGSVVATYPVSLVADYNWVIVRVLVGTQCEYTMFKPSISADGVGINLPLTQKDLYAQLKRNGTNFEFALKVKATDVLSSTTATLKAWGIKLDWINKTYAEIIALRTGNKLMPGQQYRITDYTCTTIQSNTKSAGHAFDLIVVADSVNKLNEQARAIQHDGDTYFANSKLEAWQVWYSLDNDTNRFAWADSVNGKGVIYRMIDEFNNDVPYDFKNIQFIRKITDGELDLVDGVDTWVYTFTGFSYENNTLVDGTTLKVSEYFTDEGSNLYKNNIIGVYEVKSLEEDGFDNILETLSDNVFIGRYNEVPYVEDGPAKVVDFSFNNNLGRDCYSNTFGDNCYSNTFGDGCYSNTFGYGCSGNDFGNSCYNNTFGNNCNNNTFGNSCYNNTFGNNCNNNTFGNSCYYNKITGDSVKYISVDNGIKGASSANQLELYDSAIANKTYQITYKKDADGRILMLWADDIGDTNGLYKTNFIDDTWKTIPQEIEGGTF